MELFNNSDNFPVPPPEVPVNQPLSSTTAEGGTIPIDPPSNTSSSVEGDWLSESRMETFSIFPLNRQSYVKVLNTPDFTELDASTRGVIATQHESRDANFERSIKERAIDCLINWENLSEQHCLINLLID